MNCQHENIYQTFSSHTGLPKFACSNCKKEFDLIDMEQRILENEVATQILKDALKQLEERFPK